MVIAHSALFPAAIATHSRFLLRTAAAELIHERKCEAVGGLFLRLLAVAKHSQDTQHQFQVQSTQRVARYGLIMGKRRCRENTMTDRCSAVAWSRENQPAYDACAAALLKLPLDRDENVLSAPLLPTLCPLRRPQCACTSFTCSSLRHLKKITGCGSLLSFSGFRNEATSTHPLPLSRAPYAIDVTPQLFSVSLSTSLFIFLRHTHPSS